MLFDDGWFKSHALAEYTKAVADDDREKRADTDVNDEQRSLYDDMAPGAAFQVSVQCAECYAHKMAKRVASNGCRFFFPGRSSSLLFRRALTDELFYRLPTFELALTRLLTNAFPPHARPTFTFSFGRIGGRFGQFDVTRVPPPLELRVDAQLGLRRWARHAKQLQQAKASAASAPAQLPSLRRSVRLVKSLPPPR